LARHAEKQAGSCLYLMDLLAQWSLDTRDPRVELATRTLAHCHKRQFADLGGDPDMKAPEASFYFDSLVFPAMPEADRMAVHLVSYERGRMRYEKLKAAGNPLWALLERDATCNRDLCFFCLTGIAPGEWGPILEEAKANEARLMRLIDERNGAK